MNNKEKVIKGLECCSAMSGDECRRCPYSSECRDENLPVGMPHLANDALELLKAQEPVEPILALDNGEYKLWQCGNCKVAVFTYGTKYCHNCGKVVKW